MAQYLGVDTGGTFTDFILYDNQDNSARIHKVLSTPSAPEQAILQGIKDMAIDSSGLVMIHGSTVATNAVLEGKGVRTAYITNKGFADVLTIGRQARSELYNLTPVKKPPLIPPELCLEVDSRMTAQGEHLHKLDEAGLKTLKRQIEKLAPEAVAINLLFSFQDDSEEKKIEQVVPQNIFISRSSDVLPEYKEYERGMTTTLNAKVGPLMQGYLRRLQSQLEGARLSIMQSSGGTASVDYAGRYPVHMLLSGPAGGLTGAKFVAAQSGFDKLLSFDMGGTSTDVSIIDREIGFTTEAHIGGYPVSVPMVDMHTIGAGGGSIARVDEGGMLLVGPQSAGADPGPACYGKGGLDAAVTDANVVLGRLLPAAFLGGQMDLDVEKSKQAVGRIADKLGLPIEQAAKGIIDVVNDHMVRALRVMSVQRGEDPKDYTLVSFGGAGGLHVCALAEALEMKRALVPVNAGVLSALGMVAAQPVCDRSRTVNKFLSKCDAEELCHLFAELTAQAEQEMQVLNAQNERASSPFTTETNSTLSSTRKRGTSNSDTIVRPSSPRRRGPGTNREKVLTIDIRYKGQSNALNLPWTKDLAELAQSFHQAHENAYGHRMNIEVELVNLRVRLTGEAPSFVLPEWQTGNKQQPGETTVAGFDEPVPVYQREQLQAGEEINGPVLIVEVTSTTWIDEGWHIEVDKIGNLLLESSE